DGAGETEKGGGGGGGDAVLAGAGLGDHALLAHAVGEQALADGVVDLVRAGVEEVFALEEDARAAELVAQALGIEERRRAADVVAQDVRQLPAEGALPAGAVVGADELVQGSHQRLRDKASAVGAEIALRIRTRTGLGHAVPPGRAAAAAQDL